MQKLLILVLFIAALFFALYLRSRKRSIPLVSKGTGLRGRFWIAASVFAALLGCKSVGENEKGTKDSGTTPMTTPGTPGMSGPSGTSEKPFSRPLGAVRAIQKVWRAMNVKTGGQFKELVSKEVTAGRMDKTTATALVSLFVEIISHRDSTRGGNVTKCYKMSATGGFIKGTRESVLKRVETLKKAYESGTLTREVAIKTSTALALDVERWSRGKAISNVSWKEAKKAIDMLEKTLKVASGESVQVAETIVELQTGMVVKADQGMALKTMKKRVAALFNKGPSLSDWNDPDIRPNIKKILSDFQIIENQMMVSCYDRMASPVAARSEELKKLRAAILDKNVKAGVLDVETAGTAMKEPPIAYANAKDVAEYQKRVRRLVRLLYKHGELPSKFVRKLERAVGIPMVRFNPHKKLRNDVSYYLRASFYGPQSGAVLAALVKAGVIRKARNHRGLFGNPGTSKNIPDSRVVELAKLLKSGKEVVLPADGKTVVPLSRFPTDERAYRLKVRRAARALMKTGLASHSHLHYLEGVIGGSLNGKLGK